MSSTQVRNQSPKGTTTPQKKVVMQNQQSNNGAVSPPKTPKSPTKVSKTGGKSPPHSPSQGSGQLGNQPTGSRRQSPSSNQRQSSKGIRKASPKGKANEKQQQAQIQVINPEKSSQQPKIFFDKNEMKQAMSSPKALENYWQYQESVQRRILDYKERADQNLRNLSNYNDKLRKMQERFYDFDTVRDEILSYKTQKRYQKQETEDSFAMKTEEQQYQSKQKGGNSPTQIRLSPSNIKLGVYANDQQSQLDKNKSQDRVRLHYKLQQQEAYEKMLDNKLKNDASLYKNTEIEESIHLEKMALQYFAQKDKEQGFQNQPNNNPEDFIKLDNDLYNQSPPKYNHQRQLDLQQEKKPEEFQSHKERRNSMVQQQNDRFNTFQTYNNRRLEDPLIQQPNKLNQVDRSSLLTPDESELLANDKNKKSPNSTKKYRDLSNEKYLNNSSRMDPERLSNLQYKYLLDKLEYEKFLGNKLDDDNLNSNSNNNKYYSYSSRKQYPVAVGPITKENQIGGSYSDGKYRRKSITRLDTQQNDNQLRNRLGLTEDLSTLAQRQSNHHPHSKTQQYRGERQNTNESNFTFLPNIKDNRRVSLDTNQINQNKYIRNMEIDNIFQNQGKTNISQRHTPTNRNYAHNK